MKVSSDFNIAGIYNEFLDEPLWYLSDGTLTEEEQTRLEAAYVQVRCMWLQSPPIIITPGVGRSPNTGEICRDVFFCLPREFKFGKCSLLNSSFWDICLEEKGFVDSLLHIGNLMLNNNKGDSEQWEQWHQEKNLHCFVAYPDRDVNLFEKADEQSNA